MSQDHRAHDSEDHHDRQDRKRHQYHQDRRRFLSTLVTTLGAAAATLTGSGHAVDAMAAVVPARTRLDRIGIQLYSLRKPAAVDLAGTLAALARIGYKEIELAGLYNHPAKQVHELLANNGLFAPSAHIALDQIERQPRETIADGKVLGLEWITVPSLPVGKFVTVDDWKGIATRFNRAATELKAAGFRFAFHNHNDIVRTTNGVLPIQILMAETDPALVSFQMDIFWTMNGGADPLALLARYPTRFRMLHVKDGRPSQATQTDVGQGAIDFKAIFAQAPGIEHYFVESDTAIDPFAFAAASYKYLANLEF